MSEPAAQPMKGRAAARVDAHCHLWRYADGHNAWIEANPQRPNMARLQRDFAPADLAGHLRASGLDSAVLVQAAALEDETAAMLRLASPRGAAGPLSGVVGYVDPERPGAAEAVARLAADPACVGIRLWPLAQAAPDWILGPALATALDAIEAARLPVDMLIRPPQLGALDRLLDLRPGLHIVICHAAKPEIGQWSPGDADFTAWDRALGRLAARGCRMKLSGMVSELGDDWRPADIAPYLEVLQRHFPAEALMWGSDWPVVERAGGYAKWHDTVAEAVQTRPEAECGAIFGGTARAFYGLAP